VEVSFHEVNTPFFVLVFLGLAPEVYEIFLNVDRLGILPTMGMDAAPRYQYQPMHA